MNKNKLAFIALLLVSMVLPVKADTVNCPNMVIKNIYVEGERDDDYMLENKLAIYFSTMCKGKQWVHLDVTSPLMASYLAVALSANAQKKKVNVAINTSDTTEVSNQLAYIGIGDITY